ncbi:hypothetical protein [Sphingomonas sp. LaA6.9]|uniref:hypothetical protein n=1 Tax=Sphingomonas sp. LaA6.9 TaxID=2919914 RepID=UPI001F4F292B|nr:hypothetical protein [Sphingomonas sp. LaA6.9]MCJ8158702.1 hypothetical protein [Sphingomonas sp. LaA6.9]
MRVVSSLADIDFGIGRIARAGRNLVIESSSESTIATRVTVTPRDALKAIGALLTSPSVWLFVLTLPFAVSAGRSQVAGDSWAERRRRTGLNKPW